MIQTAGRISFCLLTLPSFAACAVAAAPSSDDPLAGKSEQALLEGPRATSVASAVPGAEETVSETDPNFVAAEHAYVDPDAAPVDGALTDAWRAQAQADGAFVGDPGKTSRTVEAEREADDPLYVRGSGDDDEIDMNDVKQSQIGDCWMLAPLSAIAMQNPQLIRDRIADFGNGDYSVTFRKITGISIFGPPSYTEYEIPANDSFNPGVGHAKPGDLDIFGHGEIWVELVEKAYATYMGGYARINGGPPAEFFEAMTGTPAHVYSGSDFTGFASGLAGFEELTFEGLSARLESGVPIVTCTRANFGSVPSYNLVSNHCYAVYRAYTQYDRHWLELRNPWATNHAKITFEEIPGLMNSVVYGWGD
ncbi:MAG TPA: C2 family cysteine protease [Polyangiaceae bacterium]|nr:C2 family cysteine protease [Polyangiaceae bacterium]